MKNSILFIILFSSLIPFASQAQTPFNNDPQNAIAIECGAIVSGDTTYATSTNVEDCDEFPSSGPLKDVWYKWVGSGSTVTLSTCGQANFDTSIGIYIGTPGSLICDSATDDFLQCSGFTTIHEFNSILGQQYYIRVYGFNRGSSGIFEMDMTCENDCLHPDNSIVEVLSLTSAELSWSDNGFAPNWNIDWVEQGVLLGNGTILSDFSENTILLSDLEAYHSYRYYIQSICGADELGDWYGPINWNQAPSSINMHEGTYTTCMETYFTDSGGASANYSNNEENVFIVYPSDPELKLQVEFLSFNCGDEGSSGDYLAVFDGEDDGYEMIVSSQDVGLEGMINTFRATNEQGALTFVFDSNTSGTHSGWSSVISCYSSVGLSDYNALTITLSPNPVIAVLEIDATTEIQAYSIYNLLGQELIQGKSFSTPIQVDLSSLPQGRYLLKTWSEDLFNVTSFIKKDK